MSKKIQDATSTAGTSLRLTERLDYEIVRQSHSRQVESSFDAGIDPLHQRGGELTDLGDDQPRIIRQQILALDHRVLSQPGSASFRRGNVDEQLGGRGPVRRAADGGENRIVDPAVPSPEITAAY